MTALPSYPQARSAGTASLLSRAIETDRIYFELAAEIEQLPGATLAWMPGLSASPAGAVVHRVNPAVIASLGTAWFVQVERRLADIGASLARIYLDARDRPADELLRSAGYDDRDELVFAHSLPEPAEDIALRQVASEKDWARKLQFHENARSSPDGHGNRAADWVALERRKCSGGMEAFLAEIDGEAVGAIGAIWGDGLLRLKNIVVHPGHRRHSIGRSMLSHVAAIGRGRGISEQCVLAVRGDAGEQFYRGAGMELIGAQVEWSKPIGAAQ